MKRLTQIFIVHHVTRCVNIVFSTQRLRTVHHDLDVCWRTTTVISVIWNNPARRRANLWQRGEFMDAEMKLQIWNMHRLLSKVCSSLLYIGKNCLELSIYTVWYNGYARPAVGSVRCVNVCRVSKNIHNGASSSIKAAHYFSLCECVFDFIGRYWPRHKDAWVLAHRLV